MIRQTVSPLELRNGLTRALQQRPDCDTLRFAVFPSKLAEPDLDGCNWTLDPQSVKGLPGPFNAWRADVEAVLQAGRLSYNLD